MVSHIKQLRKRLIRQHLENLICENQCQTLIGQKYTIILQRYTVETIRRKDIKIALLCRLKNEMSDVWVKINHPRARFFTDTFVEFSVTREAMFYEFDHLCFLGSRTC